MTPQLTNLVDTLLNINVFIFIGILVWLFLKKDSPRKK
jgi:hypothetical protein